jgi:hypothetical protein
VNKTSFYFLKCINASTPAILLSAIIVLSNGQELETLDKNFKRLRPIDDDHRSQFLFRNKYLIDF